MSMTNYYRNVGLLAVCVVASVCASAQILWKEPQSPSISAWTWGPGGEETAPRPPFRFVKERLSGTNPKVEVRDAAGRVWSVKFGSEVHSDTFAPRLVSALGYATEPTFFVHTGSISDVHHLKRAKYFIAKDGSFHGASFKLHQRGAGRDANKGAWSWVDNPFVGSRELGGLKILIMLASNWDTKDARDGEGSNNKIIHPSRAVDSSAWFAVTDWGASFGKSGGYFERDRWDWGGYRAQTPSFVRLAPEGSLHWGFKGKHGQDISAGVGLEDIRWLLPYLSRITDEELETGLAASGASAPVAREFTELIRERILQLQRVAASSSRVQQAVK
jgi:hypothetical protein